MFLKPLHRLAHDPALQLSGEQATYLDALAVDLHLDVDEQLSVGTRD